MGDQAQKLDSLAAAEQRARQPSFHKLCQHYNAQLSMCGLHTKDAALGIADFFAMQ